jgi:hypothetical protein
VISAKITNHVKWTAIVTPKIDPSRNVFVAVFRSIGFTPRIRRRASGPAPHLLLSSPEAPSTIAFLPRLFPGSLFGAFGLKISGNFAQTLFTPFVNSSEQ